MNLKKFISGVSAFAIAASAFAAMAVTASATDYNESITLGAGNGYNIASYNSSGIATAKTGITYAALRADLSELTDIDDATSVTVEFDAATYSGNVVAFGFGDASQRTTIADGSGNFKTGGLAMFFGSVNGSDFKAYDVKSGSNKSIGSGFFGKIVHAKVRFNKEAGTYDYELSQGSNKLTQTGIATDIGNLTYVEAYTKTAGAQMMFKNIKVSYTVEDAPAPVETTEAGFTYKTTIEKLTTGTVSLTIEATNGEETKTDTIDITDKLAGFTGDLMLAVIINEIPAGITITSATIEVE
jgi:hypothetical protein